MINEKEPKTKEVLEKIHEALLNKAGRGGAIKEDVVMENRLFAVICHDPDLGPRRCAEIMNQMYHYELSGYEIIGIFRNNRMANPVERRELFCWAGEMAEHFVGAIAGQKESFEEYEKKRKESFQENKRRHRIQERLIAVSIYEKYPKPGFKEDKELLFQLGDTLSRYFIYDISDAIGEVYGFPLYRDSRHGEGGERIRRKYTYGQALDRIDHLENMLERNNRMLQDLQEEFEEQLAAEGARELTDFFTRLNSEKYGCILDELLVVRKGVEELRKGDFELPIEINGLLILVKKLIQFVRDSHIEPIMKTGSIRQVTAADVEFCNYEGTPFQTPEEKKQVRVISPGWIYRDKELQISRPKVKEEE